MSMRAYAGYGRGLGGASLLEQSLRRIPQERTVAVPDGTFLHFHEPVEVHNFLFGDWRMVKHVSTHGEVMVDGDVVLIENGEHTIETTVSNLAGGRSNIKWKRVRS